MQAGCRGVCEFLPHARCHPHVRRESILLAHRSHYKSRSAVTRMKKRMKCDISVVAPYLPGKKMANWWVVVGEQSTRQLLSIKRVTISKRSAVSASYVKTSLRPCLPGWHTDAAARSGFRPKGWEQCGATWWSAECALRVRSFFSLLYESVLRRRPQHKFTNPNICGRLFPLDPWLLPLVEAQAC